MSDNELGEFVELYVPEDLQYIDGERTLPSLYSKLTSLFEDVLTGKVNPDRDFQTQVDDLYAYWDTLRRPHVEKVRTLLDPYDISHLITRDEEAIGRFLYYISGIYSIKGTVKAFRYALKLVGMDAELIRWYEPEYRKYRPADETCYSVLKIHVGNRPVTDDMTAVFNRLVELLLDICTVIPSWVYIKNLVDDVEATEGLVAGYIGSQSVTHVYNDLYSRCSMEIDARGLLGVYGVHAHPSRNIVWMIVGRYHSPIFMEAMQYDHKPELPCIEYHDALVPHAWPFDDTGPSVGYRDNQALLIHTVHPTIRHASPHNVDPLLTHNGDYRHDQLIPLPSDYYQRCHRGNSSYYYPSDLIGGSQPYPVHSGMREVLEYTISGLGLGAKTPTEAALCDRDPVGSSHSECGLLDRQFLTYAHDNTITHRHGELIGADHKGPIYDTRLELTATSVEESADFDDADSFARANSTFDDDIYDTIGRPRHDSNWYHGQSSASDYVFHNGRGLHHPLSDSVDNVLEDDAVSDDSPTYRAQVLHNGTSFTHNQSDPYHSATHSGAIIYAHDQSVLTGFVDQLVVQDDFADPLIQPLVVQSEANFTSEYWRASSSCGSIFEEQVAIDRTAYDGQYASGPPMSMDDHMPVSAISVIDFDPIYGPEGRVLYPGDPIMLNEIRG